MIHPMPPQPLALLRDLVSHIAVRWPQATCLGVLGPFSALPTCGWHWQPLLQRGSTVGLQSILAGCFTLCAMCGFLEPAPSFL